jgi:ferric-dicitrate binding protein FerR (iron transport regulator)
MKGIESTFGIGRLIAKHLTGALGAEDQQLLDAWLNADGNNAQIFDRIVAHESLAAALVEMEQINTELALANVKSRINVREVMVHQPVKLWPRFLRKSPESSSGQAKMVGLAVAAAAAAITLGTWLYVSEIASVPRNDTEMNSAQAGMNDIAPGKNGATITLADGKVIQLSDAKSGVVVNDNGIAYDDKSEIASIPRNDGRGGEKSTMLTANTARGQTYQFTLPDGTRAWLNADSKISFRSQFSGKTRKIILSGEAYFEVAKDKSHPFIVESAGQIVEVLGTHFNINSYADEGSIKTTLLEGSVRVSSLLTSTARAELGSVSLRGRTEASRGNLPGRGPSTTQSQNNNEIGFSSEASRAREGLGTSRRASRNDVVLRPSEQASLKGDALTVKEIDPSEAVAWKNGEFIFNDEPLESIMRKLARWYDIDVIYKDIDPKALFYGSMSRYDNISKVLSKLELTGGIHFKIEGRKIIVTK